MLVNIYFDEDNPAVKNGRTPKGRCKKIKRIGEIFLAKNARRYRPTSPLCH